MITARRDFFTSPQGFVKWLQNPQNVNYTIYSKIYLTVSYKLTIIGL